MPSTVIDLFSGCGGMSWGLSQAGFEVLAGLDNSAHALKTFHLNHPHALALSEDLTTADPLDLMRQVHLEVGELDCLVGGPPCQSFSKNVPASARFLDDPRNHLFKDFIRFTQVLQPQSVIIENVAEIYNAYGGQVRQQIIQELNQLGYQVSAKVLYAPDYGVPQRRRRCFFLGLRNGALPTFPPADHATVPQSGLFDETLPYISAWEAISDLPPLHNGEGYEPMPYASPPLNPYQAQMRHNSDCLYDHITRELNEKQFSRLASLEAGQGMNNLPAHLRPRSGYSGAYGRLDFEMLAPTITRWVFHPGSGRFAHPRDVRMLTMREVARLQSFSDDFRFTGTYIQTTDQPGNAVPPLLMKKLGEALKSQLACLARPE